MGFIRVEFHAILSSMETETQKYTPIFKDNHHVDDVISKIFIMLYHNDTAELKKNQTANINAFHICVVSLCFLRCH